MPDPTMPEPAKAAITTTTAAPVSGALNGAAVPRSLPTILTVSPMRARAIDVVPYCSKVPSRQG